VGGGPADPDDAGDFLDRRFRRRAQRLDRLLSFGVLVVHRSLLLSSGHRPEIRRGQRAAPCQSPQVGMSRAAAEALGSGARRGARRPIRKFAQAASLSSGSWSAIFASTRSRSERVNVHSNGLRSARSAPGSSATNVAYRRVSRRFQTVLAGNEGIGGDGSKCPATTNSPLCRDSRLWARLVSNQRPLACELGR